jgi:hypothetical protein
VILIGVAVTHNPCTGDSNCDVFNALDLMDNETFFSALKFGIGDGHLQVLASNLNSHLSICNHATCSITFTIGAARTSKRRSWASCCCSVARKYVRVCFIGELMSVD